MSNSLPRVRMFAGPNGSGKSTIKSVIGSPLLGTYINPNQIEREMGRKNSFDLSPYGLANSGEEILAFFCESALMAKANLLMDAKALSFWKGKLDLHGARVNGYLASVAADFIRRKLLLAGESFTFETVMSYPDKVELLQQARSLGYRTYLYFVATEDPAINLARVRQRVKHGGHDVPEDKIISRYARSLDLLIPAIKASDRAYIFDNSGHQETLIAEIQDGRQMELKAHRIPIWFQHAVLDKLKP